MCINKIVSGKKIEKYEGNWYILCCNLRITKDDVALAPGIILRRLLKPLSVFDLAALGAVGFREWAMLEPFLPLATTEIVSDKDSDVTSGFDILNRAWLASVLLTLRGYTKHLPLACCSQSWEKAKKIRQAVSEGLLTDIGIKANENLPEKRRPHYQILDFHRKLVLNENCKDSEISDDDIDWIYTNYDKFNRLCAESERFYFSLKAAVDWRFSENIRTAISRIWAGIESILELKSETVYRLSIITSALLKSRGCERIDFYKKIKKLYDVRSKAVHGARISDKKLHRALDDSFDILSSILVLCIERGKTLDNEDFEQALLG